MEIKKRKEQLLKKEVSVYDLSSEEVKKITTSVKRDLTMKKKELDNVNQKIKQMKAVIDNWA